MHAASASVGDSGKWRNERGAIQKREKGWRGPER
jgi:hypothetical protein